MLRVLHKFQTSCLPFKLMCLPVLVFQACQHHDPQLWCSVCRCSCVARGDWMPLKSQGKTSPPLTLCMCVCMFVDEVVVLELIHGLERLLSVSLNCISLLLTSLHSTPNLICIARLNAKIHLCVCFYIFIRCFCDFPPLHGHLCPTLKCVRG